MGLIYFLSQTAWGPGLNSGEARVVGYLEWRRWRFAVRRQGSNFSREVSGN